jgi:hypothetical protein
VLVEGAPPAGRPAASEVVSDFRRTMKKLWGG